jgi:hypothetical protein
MLRPSSIPARASLYSSPPNTREIPRETRQRQHFLWYCGIGMLLFAGSLIVWMVVIVPWWSGVTRQWHYGDARVSVVDANVGHSGISRLIAFDEDGDIIVIEVVGKRYQVYTGMVVTGGSRVVTLAIVDVNNDGRPDLVIHIEGISATPILFNTGSGFAWTEK